MIAVVVFLNLLFVGCGYVLVRNFQVGKFRNKIINLCYEHNLRRIGESLCYDSAFTWFYDKVSYEKMLYSFKPLELEYWWSKEDVDKLMS